MLKILKLFLALTGVLGLLAPNLAYSEKFAIRAREHYDVHKYNLNSQTFEYKGLSNTFNLWWEKPYQWSFGFSFNPLIGSATTEDDASPFGEKIRLWILGLEGKYFPMPDWLLIFLRGGLSYHILEVKDGVSNPEGYGGYLALGYEFKTKKLGIAPELGIRKIKFSRGVEGNLVSFSIGFHFY